MTGVQRWLRSERGLLPQRSEEATPGVGDENLRDRPAQQPTAIPAASSPLPLIKPLR